MDLGTLVLAGLALKAFGAKPATSKVPDPPPVPDNGGGGNRDLAENLGKLGGTAAGGLLSLLGGIGGVGGTSGGAGTGVVSGGATASGAGAAVGEAGAVAGGEVASVTVISAGGIFALAWAAFFVLQFIVINALTTARVAWLRYRNTLIEFANSPFVYLHHLENVLVDQTLREVLHLTPSTHLVDDKQILGSQYLPYTGLWSDPRLDRLTFIPEEGQTVRIAWRDNRTVYDNPFPAGKSGAANWRFLQMCARLVAARYVVELGKYSRRMLAGFQGLGGLQLALASPADYLAIWSYPLIGGGQPDKSYGDFEKEVRARGPAPDGTTLDDVLNSARLSAILHVAATIQKDPGIYINGDPVQYSRQLYDALGLSETVEHVQWLGTQWLFDGAFYRLPCAKLVLDIHELKGGVEPMQPFLPGSGIPQAFSLTCLKAQL